MSSANQIIWKNTQKLIWIYFNIFYLTILIIHVKIMHVNTGSITVKRWISWTSHIAFAQTGIFNFKWVFHATEVALIHIKTEHFSACCNRIDWHEKLETMTCIHIFWIWKQTPELVILKIFWYIMYIFSGRPIMWEYTLQLIGMRWFPR